MIPRNLCHSTPFSRSWFRLLVDNVRDLDRFFVVSWQLWEFTWQDFQWFLLLWGFLSYWRKGLDCSRSNLLFLIELLCPTIFLAGAFVGFQKITKIHATGKDFNWNRQKQNVQLCDVLWNKGVLSNRVEQRFQLNRGVSLIIQEFIYQWEVLDGLGFIRRGLFYVTKSVEETYDVLRIGELLFSK